MRTIKVANQKTLKLNNVLIKKVTDEELENISLCVNKMENYVRVNGAMPMGPIVQYITPSQSEESELGIDIYLMRQTDRFLVHVEGEYKMQSTLRVKNCLYAHYIGPEEHTGIARDKLQVYAFENEIELKGTSYTVFVDRKDDIVVTDIFMEMEENGN